MAKPVRVLFYAINGTGLGHLTRVLAIARKLRELLDALDVPADLRILTTSEASGSVWDFPVYKVPSHTVAVATGLDRAAFVASSRLLVINLVASVHPEILVVDTVPHGAFGEISMLAGHCGSLVYVDRHKDPAASSSELYRRHLPLYDRILVPDHGEQHERYPLPVELTPRRRFVGPVHAGRPEAALSADEVRQYFAVEPGKRLVFVAAGGGGDHNSRATLAHLVCSLSADPANHLLVGYGPLHQGEAIYRSNVTPLFETGVSRYFAGVDLAVSAAGYNSYEELLDAAVPTLFYPEIKGLDRQDERIRLGLERGWHAAFPAPPLTLSAVEISRAAAEVFQGDARERILEALESRPAARGALHAAAEIALLHAARSSSPLQRCAILDTALLRAAWKPGGVAFAVAARALARWRTLTLRAADRAELEEQRARRWPNGPSPADCEEIGWGTLLAGVDPDLLRRWCAGAAAEGSEEHQLRLGLHELLARLERDVAPETLASLGSGAALRRAVAAHLDSLEIA